MEEFELEPGERVIEQVRQHPFVLFLRVLPLLLLAVLPFVLLPLLSLLDVLAFETGEVSLGIDSPMRFFLGLWWLFLWMGIFQIIVKYFLTSWVITSHRIVDIQQQAFFRRKVSSFLLVRVQDVTTNVRGILATLIGYGDINVETAGNVEEFHMRGVGTPEALRDLVMREVAVLHSSNGSNAVDVKSGV